jgi:hypothetical protein
MGITTFLQGILLALAKKLLLSFIILNMFASLPVSNVLSSPFWIVKVEILEQWCELQLALTMHQPWSYCIQWETLTEESRNLIMKLIVDVSVNYISVYYYCISDYTC